MSNDIPDPCVTAARALAFAEDERMAGRTVTIAMAVRHVVKHGYPPISAAASFAETRSMAGSKEITADTILVAARALQMANPGLSEMGAVQQVSAAVRYGETAAPSTVAFAERADKATESRIFLEAGELNESHPALDFFDRVRMVAKANGYLLKGLKLFKQTPATASFAEATSRAAGDAAEAAHRRAAAQLRRLCPSLHYDECLRCVRGLNQGRH